MTPDPTRDHSALRWVRAEIEETLRQARLQLEDYVEEDADNLDDCVRHLHQVHGTLDMVQVYGGAMLADELESLAEAINEERIAATDAAVEVLMMGMVQLPAYLERIESGEPDIPLILLPLMNDLRASRDAPLVSEMSLFAPKLDSLIAAEEVLPGSGNPALGDSVRQRRPNYHRGLLKWFRNLDSSGGLSQIREVIEALAAEARTRRMRRLFDAAEALVVTLQDGSLSASVALKLLFGQLDRVFRRIMEQGEEAVARDFPLELLKNLLYYVARSNSDDPVVQAVRQSADLANSFPDIAYDDVKSGTLGGPGKALFEAVGDALKSDLRDIKDQLDLYMRGDRADFARLSTLVDPIRRVGDTLGMVGRGELRSRLMPHCERIADAVTGQQVPTDNQLMGLASDLLFVESSLAELDRQPAQPRGDQSEQQRPLLQAMSAGEFREHVQAAVDQGFVELARIKDSILRFLESPEDLKALNDIPQLVHRVAGSLVILEQPEASRLLDDLGRYVGELASGERPLPGTDQREALAELVSGIELHMESVVHRRPDHGRALLAAEAACERLGLDEGLGLQEAAVEASVEPVESAQPDEPEALPQPAEPVSPPAAVSVPDEVDSEILEIFVEEAREELEAIRENYPRWRNDNDASEALARMRRSFHTLKGSGRLVGAMLIGEFAWSVENLLNRVIDGTVTPSAEVFGLLDDVLETLPGLVDAQESGTPYAGDVEGLQQRAFDLAGGGGPGVPARSTAPAAAAPTSAVEAAAEADDSEPTGSIEAVPEAPESQPEAVEGAPEPQATDVDMPATVADEVEPAEPEPAPFDTEDVEELLLDSLPLEDADSAALQPEDVSIDSPLADDLQPEALSLEGGLTDEVAPSGEITLDADDLDQLQLEDVSLDAADLEGLELEQVALEIDESVDLQVETLSLDGLEAAEQESEAAQPGLVGDEVVPVAEDVPGAADGGDLQLEAVLPDLEEAEQPQPVEAASDQQEIEQSSLDAEGTAELQLADLASEDEAPLAESPSDQPVLETGASELLHLDEATPEATAADTSADVEARGEGADPTWMPDSLDSSELDELDLDLGSEEILLEEPEEESIDSLAIDSALEPLQTGPAEDVDSEDVSSFSEALEAALQAPDEDSEHLEAESILDPQLEVDEDSQEFESILNPLEEEPAPIQLESTLYDIFGNEARTHLATIEAFVDDCRGQPAGCAFNEPLTRALHTLRGSAHMAGVAPIAELASALERWTNLNIELGRRTDTAAIDLLERAHFVINAVLGVVNRSGAIMPTWQPLLKEIQGLADALAHHAEPKVADAGESQQLDLDPELLGIFLEEAQEIGEGMEQEFDKWRSRPSDLLPVSQLQRLLHTIKGAARLSGLPPIGDLAHAMESLFESVVERRIDSDEQQLELVRHAMDALAAQIEAVQEGNGPPAQPGLVDRLEAAAHGRPWEPVAVELETETETEPSIEAEDTELGSMFALDEVSETRESTTLLSDSNLLTDSELLGDSDFASTSFVVGESADGGIGNSLQEDSRIIQFPPRGRHAAEESEAPVRRPPPPEEKGQKSAASQERVRVRADLLDQLVNNAGEVSIYRARLEQQNKTQGYNLDELGQTIERLRSQLRSLELETEAQILSRHEREYEGESAAGFDPLEMDRYSTMQQLSRALSETVNDLASIGVTLQDMNRDSETLLLQQARVNNDLQDGLLRTRMVPVASRTSRLQRVVRQTAQGVGKRAELSVIGGQGEMDRAILERMMAPLEHLLRNAVAHGIESPGQRAAADKPENGVVSLVMSREGGDVLLTVSDDGRGFDREAIRAKAIERGLLDDSAQMDDDDLDQFILQAGFSTAEGVSQIAGRGVGLDVVLSEVKQLGGSLDIDSQPGRGSSFSIRLPFTLAITESLLVTVGDEVYAVPHGSIDGIVRIPSGELEACYRGEQETFSYGDRDYQVRYLGSMLSNARPSLPEGVRWFPLLLVRSGEHRVAIQVDGLLGNRQIVVKSVGAQLSTVRWFTGGTILADGRIALILDVNSLVRLDGAHQQPQLLDEEVAPQSEGVSVMVVDDSITVRKVTSRLLECHNMQVITAKDGVDAVAVLQEHKPDVMLLDIEMPRMDGFELARHMRSSEELKGIPIIMITSRTGDKHRTHAMELGVKRYLGKPYQEADLLENIYTVLAESDYE